MNHNENAKRHKFPKNVHFEKLILKLAAERPIFKGRRQIKRVWKKASHKSKRRRQSIRVWKKTDLLAKEEENFMGKRRRQIIRVWEEGRLIG